MDKIFDLLINALYLAIICVAFIWLYHALAPVAAHYLSAEEVTLFRGLFFGLVGVEALRRGYLYLRGL